MRDARRFQPPERARARTKPGLLDSAVTATDGLKARPALLLAKLGSQPILAKRPLAARKRGRRSVARDTVARTRRRGKRVFRTDRHDDRRVDEAAARSWRNSGKLGPSYAVAVFPQLSAKRGSSWGGRNGAALAMQGRSIIPGQAFCIVGPAGVGMPERRAERTPFGASGNAGRAARGRR